MSDERATGAAAEHLDRIRELCSTIRWGENDYSDVLDGIQHHAEALATLAAPATGGGDREQRFRELATEGAFKAIYRRCDQLAEIKDGLVFHAAKEIRDNTDLLASRFEAPATGGGDNEHLAAIKRSIRDAHRDLDTNDTPGAHLALDCIEDSAEALASDNAALRARLAEAEARIGRLRKALTAQNGRILDRRVYDELERTGGDLPSQVWISRRRDTILGNLFAIDGLQPGDLPDEEGGDTCPHGQPWDDCPDCRH